MKRGWIALVMIALSLLLGITEYSYVTSNSNVYLRMLEEADQRMEEHDFIGAESTAKRRYRERSHDDDPLRADGQQHGFSRDLRMREAGDSIHPSVEAAEMG